MILTEHEEAMGVKNTNDLTDNMKENKKGKTNVSGGDWTQLSLSPADADSPISGLKPGKI